MLSFLGRLRRLKTIVGTHSLRSSRQLLPAAMRQWAGIASAAGPENSIYAWIERAPKVRRSDLRSPFEKPLCLFACLNVCSSVRASFGEWAWRGTRPDSGRKPSLACPMSMRGPGIKITARGLLWRQSPKGRSGHGLVNGCGDLRFGHCTRDLLAHIAAFKYDQCGYSANSIL